MRRLASALVLAAACAPSGAPDTVTAAADSMLAAYTTVRLDPDLSGLTDNERKMLPLLIDAAEEMDKVFWYQVAGDRDSILAAVANPSLRRLVEINYGPWDRLGGNAPFMAEVGELPPGKHFYPPDMTKAEFDSAAAAAPDGGAALRSLYTVVRRNGAGGLTAVPYHVIYKSFALKAATKLREAATYADDPGLRNYLQLRAEALLNDEYQASDMAWMEMKDNGIDVVIGPIEVYDDELYGYKAAHEAFVLVKDREWSDRLSRYATLLPGLQRNLPVEARFKTETPGSDSDLNAYDVVYVAGQTNAGSKTIAINLPNDEEVQLAKGTRRLQLKNAVRAKFEKILVPIAGVLIAEDQREHVTFDAFFENVMFHEVAHGLGIKNTINGRGTVRSALKEQYSSMEEGKADVLGLYMVRQLADQGELGERDLRDNYVTFIASIFRSIRFGASSAHGRANVARFNFFEDMGAFTRDSATGTYRVDFDRVVEATNALSAKILEFQGTGDYDGAVAWMAEMGVIRPQLQADLDRLGSAGIPVDVTYEMGKSVLGLDEEGA